MNRIIYFGPSEKTSTSKHRAEALRRLGHEVIENDPFIALRHYLSNSILRRLHYHTGYKLIQDQVASWIKIALSNSTSADIVWVDGGELFGREIAQYFRERNLRSVLFNHDDPTGNRDRRRFSSLLSALPYYDIATAVREQSEIEMKKISKGKVVRVWRTYDEVEHRPLDVTDAMTDSFQSDVCFIGTWIRGENRDGFIKGLIERGIHVAIWGDRWHHSGHWSAIKGYWRGGAIGGRDYVRAISGAKICLGLLSKQNRDLHTTRTMEIPYAGGLLCAERTKDHQELYIEGEEAIFWDTVDECADQCKKLLLDASLREKIKLSGSRRVRANHVGNEDACEKIISALSFAEQNGKGD